MKKLVLNNQFIYIICPYLSILTPNLQLRTLNSVDNGSFQKKYATISNKYLRKYVYGQGSSFECLL